MPRCSTAYAKNIIKRSLREIVDPSPSDKDRNKLWEYFNSKCAYCNCKLNRKAREGHIDHLISAAKGGSNYISNRVLSCATCNEKEKRDMPWQKFLSQKVLNKKLMDERKNKILEWKKLNNDPSRKVNKKLIDEIEKKRNVVFKIYDRTILEIQKLKDSY